MYRLKSLRLPLAILIVAAAAGTAQGAGFSLFEQGTKATALGGAFTAEADDPTAMFYNPAGTAFLDKFTMEAGGFLILRPTAHFEGANPFPGAGYETNMRKSIYDIGHGYAVVPVAKGFNVSAGFWSPYGLGVPWQEPDTFRGRYINQRVDLRMIAASVQASLKLADWISIGAGPEARISDVKFSRNVPFVNPFSQKVVDVAHISLISQGTQVKWAWTAGILLKPIDRLRIGGAFHSHVDYDYSGAAVFGQIPSGNPQFDAIVAARLPFGAAGAPAHTAIQFPSVTMLGVSFDVTPKVTVNVDADYWTWKVFDQTVISIQGLPDTTLVHDFKNTWAIRAGAQFKPSPDSWVGGGFVYDQTPQPDEDVSPFLPDSNRTGVSVGAGFKMGPFSFEVASLFLWFHNRTTTTQQDNYNGTYKTFAILPGASVRASF